MAFPPLFPPIGNREEWDSPCDAWKVEIVEALVLALDVQWAVGRQVPASDLVLDTPCPGWTVYDVMNHSVGITLKFTDFAAGLTDHPRSPTGDLLGGDHPTALRSAADAAQSAWASADLSRRCVLPFGTFPGELAAEINLVDVLAHTWDISTSVGVPLECDDGLWLAALGAATHVIGPDRGGGHYAPEARPTGSSTPRQRFIGSVGRSESWRSG